MITGKPSARLAHADVDPAHFRFTFWLVYAAHFSMTLATTMFYRIADLVTLLGGTEFDLGWIVGCGTAGGLTIRAIHAVASDAYGPKILWLIACVGAVVSCAAHLGVPLGWLWVLYLIRFFYTASINGFFGGSITYMSGRAPVTRMAEVIGNLGTAGFIGMIVGPFLLDAILGHGEVTRERMNVAIWVAVASALVGTVCSIWGTRGDGGWQRRRHPPVLAVIRRYHPGVVLLVAMAGGFALSLPSVFLRPFLEVRGITGIAAFFAIYPAVAFVTRLSIRRFPERYGVRVMILLGLFFLVFGSLSYLCITEWWHVALPAAMLGVAHAVLFPSLVASSTVGYPLPFRGVGMALVLAAFDMGSLIGMPVAGSVLTWAEEIGWDKYPTLFVSVTLVFVMISLAYLMPNTEQSRSSKTHRI